jgi:hypothetical protein
LDNSRDIENVIDLFHSQIKHFNDEQILTYIDELMKTMKLNFDHGGLDFWGKAPERSGIFIEELNNVKKSIQGKKHIENESPSKGLSDEVEITSPPLTTIYGTDEKTLRAAHKIFQDAGFIKKDIDSWLYWFGGKPCDKHKQLEWNFKKGERGEISSLLYFLDKLCPDFGTFEKKNRKIKEANAIFGIKINGQSKKTTLNDVKTTINKAFEAVK